MIQYDSSFIWGFKFPKFGVSEERKGMMYSGTQSQVNTKVLGLIRSSVIKLYKTSGRVHNFSEPLCV